MSVPIRGVLRTGTRIGSTLTPRWAPFVSLSSVSSFSQWRVGSNAESNASHTPSIKLFERTMSLAELRRPGSMAMFGPSFAYEHMQHIERMAAQQESTNRRRSRLRPDIPPPEAPLSKKPSPFRFSRNRTIAKAQAAKAAAAAPTTSTTPEPSPSTPSQSASQLPLSTPALDDSTPATPTSPSPSSIMDDTPAQPSLELISTRRQRYRKMKRHKYRKRLRKLRHSTRKPFSQ